MQYLSPNVKYQVVNLKGCRASENQKLDAKVPDFIKKFQYILMW